MFGRKRQRAEARTGRPVRLDHQKMMRVWMAFLNDPNPPPAGAPGPGQGPPPAPPLGSFVGTAPAPAPPLGGGGPGDSGLVFNITPFSGSETPMGTGSTGGAAPGRVFNLPGFGPVDVQKMQAASQRLQAVIRDLMGADSAALDPSSSWGPEEARLALARLPGLHAEGRVDAEQFEALQDLLQSVAGPGET